jgi:two-component system LytT family sensor kinase
MTSHELVQTAQERRRVLLVLTLPWLVPGLVASVEVYFFQSQNAGSVPFGSVLIWQLAAWSKWAGWILLVRYVALRYPLERIGASRWVALHATAMLVVAACDLWINSLLDRRFTPALATIAQYRLIRMEWLQHFDYDIMGSIYMVEFHRRFRQRDLEAARLRTELVVSQLEALRMQVNPHFLFNALNGVGELLHTDAVRAQQVISRIAELLRQALRIGAQQEVPLWKELELAQAYVDIACMRFGDRISLHVTATPNTLDLRLPALLLQPLIENSVQHGFQGRSDDAVMRIVLRADILDKHLMVEISDDGRAEAGNRRSGFGIGLSNTRARLHAMYRDEASLEVCDLPEGGFVARVLVPQQHEASAYTAFAGNALAIPSETERAVVGR